MKLDSALSASGTAIACRLPRAHDPTGAPNFVVRQLTGFSIDGKQTPIYEVYCFRLPMAQPVSPVLAHQYDDWEPYDKLDAIDALASLDDRPPEQVQAAVIERRRELYVPYNAQRHADLLWMRWSMGMVHAYHRR